MNIEPSNIFKISSNLKTVAIENIHPEHTPRMSQESAANLAAWLVVHSGVTDAEFAVLVANARQGLKQWATPEAAIPVVEAIPSPAKE